MQRDTTITIATIASIETIIQLRVDSSSRIIKPLFQKLYTNVHRISNVRLHLSPSFSQF